MTEEDKAVCKVLVSFAKLIQQLDEQEEKGFKDYEKQEESAEEMGTKFMETYRVTIR